MVVFISVVPQSFTVYLKADCDAGVCSEPAHQAMPACWFSKPTRRPTGSILGIRVLMHEVIVALEHLRHGLLFAPRDDGRVGHYFSTLRARKKQSRRVGPGASYFSASCRLLSCCSLGRLGQRIGTDLGTGSDNEQPGNTMTKGAAHFCQLRNRFCRKWQAHVSLASYLA